VIDVQPILTHYGPYLLVLFRVTGLFLMAPLLTSTTIPAQAKVLLAVAFAAAIYASTPVARQTLPPLDPAAFIPLIFSELLVGFVLGLLAALPLIGLQMAGMVMSYQMGLSLAASYNPEMDTEGDVLTQLMYLLGILTFLSIGGLDVVFGALASTFDTLPIGSLGAGDLPLDGLVALLTAGFELALRLSAPVLATIALVLVSLGVVMKTMPQINVMSVGFSIKIVGGLATLAAVLFVVGRVAGDEIADGLMVVDAWAGSLARAGG
jgi:flagellar biosynthetic protein FliR